jgi:hypothetical protein
MKNHAPSIEQLANLSYTYVHITKEEEEGKEERKVAPNVGPKSP